MVNFTENLIVLLETSLFFIAGGFFIASFFYGRKVRKHILPKSSFLVDYFMPSVFVPSNHLDEKGIRYKKKLMSSLLNTLICLILAIGLVYSGIEIIKAMEHLIEAGAVGSTS